VADWRLTPLVRGGDGKRRCAWCLASAEYVAYHDTEWGRPVVDDTRLFEKLCLEGFQAGLSWLTILRKRDNFRRAFHGFDCERVARFTARDVTRLLGDAGIIRQRAKIEAAIANARAMVALHDGGGSLAELMWTHEPPRRRTVPKQFGEIPAVTSESTALARELKRQGFRFVGPTTMYAAMQSLGLVNDHLQGCHVRAACTTDRRALDATIRGLRSAQSSS
jgi:DNA-3-methyladenine glycosylase I